MLTRCLKGNDSAGSVCARRHLTKLILGRPPRQRNGLMIYSKVERALVITRQIFNYYSSNFSLEITSEMENIGQKHTFTHKLTQIEIVIFIFLAQLLPNRSKGLWDVKGSKGYIYAAYKRKEDSKLTLTLDSDVP